jgi:thiamine biosynthesis lipoprotein
MGLRHVEHVLGTTVSLDVRGHAGRAPVGPGVRRAAREAVTWLRHVDALFSRRPDSQLSRLERGEITVADCAPEVAEVLMLCDDAARASGGWFDHTAGGRLDPSGLVRGWAVERVSDLLYAAGAHDTRVNGGGDIQLRGTSAPGRPWRVTVAHPLRREQTAAVVTGFDLAVATVAAADPARPVDGEPHFASITLTGPRIAMVGAFATAAFAMGPAAAKWIAGLPGIAALAVTSAGDAWQTGDFPGIPPE